MKRALALVILGCVLLTTVARADTIGFINKHGAVSIANSGIVVTGSNLIQYGNIKAPPGHSLGSVSFSTGALTSGSVLTGGIFSSAGSSFEVIGKSKLVPKGVLFSGNFVGNVRWILVSKTGPNLVFDLKGRVEGQLYNGRFIVEPTTQTIVTTVNQLAKGIGHVKFGKTPLTLVTPEPATIVLATVGLTCILFRTRSRLKGKKILRSRYLSQL